MAKRSTKVLPARKEESAENGNDDSLLIRSAESLGRVIGTLQRQVRGGTTTVASMADEAREALSELARFEDLLQRRPPARKRSPARKSSGRKTKTARKAAAPRKTARARKPTARKTAKKR